MAAGEDLNNREDNVYSEKIITEESEKTETYDHEVKRVNGEEHTDEFWLKDAKDNKIDNEGLDFLSTEDELDIAIINDIAVTEDDTTLRSLTFRSLFTGFVSIQLYRTIVVFFTNSFIKNRFLLLLVHLLLNL